jgi:hypothetical protein
MKKKFISSKMGVLMYSFNSALEIFSQSWRLGLPRLYFQSAFIFNASLGPTSLVPMRY